MQRKIDTDLLAWSKKPSRKPLLLRGGRQTGKSFAAARLGESFGHLCIINFERSPALRQIFEADFDPRRIVRELSAATGAVIVPGETLVFLDEIQDCPRAVSALRYFHEELPALHIIGAGSLLEFELRAISIPVGRVEFLYTYPLSFDEFLRAAGKSVLADEVLGAGPEQALPASMHSELLRLLREFLFVGGMPGVLKRYFAENSVLAATEELDAILQTYRADFAKYAGRGGLENIRRVFDAIPFVVGSKVSYAKIIPGARAAQVRAAIDLLAMAHLLKKIRATAGAGLPLGALASDADYKLAFLDVGLVQRLAGTRHRDWISRDLIISDLTGIICEQFAAQELAFHADPHCPADLYYWERKTKSSTAEVDYLIAAGGRVYPLEVKSGAAGHLRSMMIFLGEHPRSHWGLRLSERPFGREGQILSIPLYAFSAINRIVEGLD